MNNTSVKHFAFSSKTYPCYFNGSVHDLKRYADTDNIIIITDENIASVYAQQLSAYQLIVIPAGEQYKQQSTADKIIIDLINLKADRDTFLIGLGGGVVTDIAGYAAAIYMRGIRFAQVPSSVLGMVDAVVGGKNGVDAGVYKNLIGTIRQPDFLLFDYSLLHTLPQAEWINGFAEIIKHACIKDAELFSELEDRDLHYYRQSSSAIADIIERNVLIKYAVVSSDEKENGERRLLNFGHTLGHAMENLYHIPHGHAISIGMVAACRISEQLANFSIDEVRRVTDLLQRYDLPVYFDYDKERVWEIMFMDKKRSGDYMNYVMLDKIGSGIVQKIPLPQLRELFEAL